MDAKAAMGTLRASANGLGRHEPSNALVGRASGRSRKDGGAGGAMDQGILELPGLS